MTESAAQQQTSANVASEYNRVFEKFVGESPDGMSDIVGIVAYGIYKNAKREWATDFRAAYGRAPSQDDLRAYHATWTPAQIQSARNSAAQVMAEYADTVISEEEPRILRDAVKGRFWPSIFTSMFANACYTLILIFIAVILAKAGIDLIGLISAADKS